MVFCTNFDLCQVTYEKHNDTVTYEVTIRKCDNPSWIGTHTQTYLHNEYNEANTYYNQCVDAIK